MLLLLELVRMGMRRPERRVVVRTATGGALAFVAAGVGVDLREVMVVVGVGRRDGRVVAWSGRGGGEVGRVRSRRRLLRCRGGGRQLVDLSVVVVLRERRRRALVVRWLVVVPLGIGRRNGLGGRGGRGSGGLLGSLALLWLLRWSYTTIGLDLGELGFASDRSSEAKTCEKRYRSASPVCQAQKTTRNSPQALHKLFVPSGPFLHSGELAVPQLSHAFGPGLFLGSPLALPLFGSLGEADAAEP